MAATHPIDNSTIYAGATVDEHGALIPDRHLPLRPGEHVALAISKGGVAIAAPLMDLVGTLISYDSPFDPAVSTDDWEAGSAC